MGSSDGLSNSRSTQGGKETLIPNATPFPCIPPLYYNNNLSHHLGGGSNGPNPNPTPAEMIGLTKSHHHRCSSESVLQVEEKPSWLDDLLDEPDSPLYKGHRRSASDSSAYIDMNGMSVADTFNRRKQSIFNDFSNGQQWNLTDHSNQVSSFSTGQQNWVSESSPNPSSMNFLNGFQPTRDGSAITPQNSSGLNACGSPQEADRPHTVDQKQDRAGSNGSQNAKNSSENGEYSQPNASASRADGKHTKQKTAHRSRVRKLQYIAELERNVHALQAEGSAVFAEIEFLDQHNLILSMENRALRQRLDSLSQEQLIKQLQHEMLERELGRLQALFQFQMQQQQQQQHQQQQRKQQQNAKNNRAKFKDLDTHFNNFSLNQNEASSSTDSTHSYTRI